MPTDVCGQRFRAHTNPRVFVTAAAAGTPLGTHGGNPRDVAEEETK